MPITDRQKHILGAIIEEYTLFAQPVGSKALKNKSRLNICPASIRNEMQALTEKGYLIQPHTSAGRIPTDKAFRFWVDNLIDTNFDQASFDEINKVVGEKQDILELSQLLAKALSNFSLGLTASYLLEKDLFFKEGWEEIFHEPEFQDFDYSLRFLGAVKTLEEKIKDIALDKNDCPQVYIGKENSIPNLESFSLIVSSCAFGKDNSGLLLILGPKRMPYQKNIKLINSAKKLLELL